MLLGITEAKIHYYQKKHHFKMDDIFYSDEITKFLRFQDNETTKDEDPSKAANRDPETD
jgi:hypothetical protein